MLRSTPRLLRVPVTRRLATAASQTSQQTKTNRVHPIRRFFTRVTLSVTLFYATGLVLSEFNDACGAIFTEHVPYGEELVDFFESTWYSAAYSPLTLDELKSKFGEILASRTSKVPHGGVIAKNVDPKDREADNLNDKANLPKVKVSMELLKLQPLRAPTEDGSPEALRFKEIIAEFNGTIDTINQQNIMLPEPQATAVLEAHDALAMKILEFEQNFESALTTGINTKTDAALEGAGNKYEEELKQKEIELTDRFLNEFSNFRAELEQRTQKQLAADLKANEQTLLAKHANEVALLSITQVKEFNKIISEKIDSERNGKLAHLQELDEAVNNLTKSVDGVNKFLMKSEAITQLTLALDELKNKINSPKNASIKIDRDLQKLNTLADIIPGLPKPCCHSKDVKPALLTVALNELNELASEKEILSTEQLYNRWNLLESDFKTASLLPPNAGIMGHTFAKFFSFFLFTKQGSSPINEDLDNVYAKVSERLRLSKLDEAVEEVLALKGWPHVLCKDWIVQARKRLEVESLISVLDNEVRTL
ncbi:hypothetical protein ZYGR_0AD06660 [Zygosaccharomyces rouxii]|uniref:MICOS complex subunit MIC60 n=2 Tax=Zygosaccharomyces rouxii TaxID=4956 RepID=C5E1J1_ZYGRC|nr:uncharacterized protein ZYRO0G21406g [Zygosaccharomyces rouxii]KAH9202965.1 mitochondrial inner membrane protein-domain-containing protein [Zygosaccharomyces rouxii]GAV51483.1 hypothetical protein ZYGR_0AD06660 [Zygosaccharomyces rouxii]CAR29975.1 ZYRO0G21406p [Zygosaccharomyces rouxii]